jgi:hypothetical protein
MPSKEPELERMAEEATATFVITTNNREGSKPNDGSGHTWLHNEERNSKVGSLFLLTTS